MTTEGRDVTQEMVDWVIAELRYKAQIFKTVGAISVYDGDVVKSDTAVRIEVKKALQAAVNDLDQRGANSIRDDGTVERHPQPTAATAIRRRRAKSGPSPRDDLVDIVRDDPDAAANILRNWIGSAN